MSAVLKHQFGSSERRRPVRILHVINSLDPASGGPVEGLRQLSHIYNAGGHEVHVATLDAPEDIETFNFPAPVIGLGPSIGIYGYSPRAVPWLEKHVSEYDTVFINCIWQYNAVAAFRAVSRSKIPYGVFTHGMLDPYFKRAFPLKHIKKSIYWHLFLQRVLKNADAVLFTCEEEKILARQSFSRYKVRERVLNYGIFTPDLDLAGATVEFLEKFPNLRGKRIAIAMGRVHPKKGIDILIEAFAQSLGRYPEWELVIAGPDQIGQQAELQALAMRLGVAEKITWTGMIGGALKWGALAASEVFVLPSHQENFGIVVAEALACRLPVIISDKVNIWREIKRHGAGLICSDSVESTRNSLNQWSGITDGELAAMRVRSMECFNECFNYDMIAEKVLGVTESIVQRRQQR
jgi:glycosyltransferase involved in cell wall biosynthesis